MAETAYIQCEKFLDAGGLVTTLKVRMSFAAQGVA